MKDKKEENLWPVYLPPPPASLIFYFLGFDDKKALFFLALCLNIQWKKPTYSNSIFSNIPWKAMFAQDFPLSFEKTCSLEPKNIKHFAFYWKHHYFKLERLVYQSNIQRDLFRSIARNDGDVVKRLINQKRLTCNELFQSTTRVVTPCYLMPEMLPAQLASKLGRQEILNMLFQFKKDKQPKSTDIGLIAQYRGELTDIIMYRRSSDLIRPYFKRAMTMSSTGDIFHDGFLLAAYYGHLSCMQTLAQWSKTIMATQTEEGDNAWHYAVQWGHLDVVHYLSRSSEFDVNQQDRRGRTVLHYCIENGDIQMFDFLHMYFKGRIDYGIVDNDGQTPKSLAMASHNIYFLNQIEECCSVIKNHGFK